MIRAVLEQLVTEYALITSVVVGYGGVFKYAQSILMQWKSILTM